MKRTPDTQNDPNRTDVPGDTEATNRIERSIRLASPRSRVWRALTNAEEFGRWFGVDLAGSTFGAGQRVRGKVLIPGYEHVTFDITIERIEPERVLAWRWHPAAIEKGVDYSNEPTTLVTFELEEKDGGTQLTVVETGFDRLPPERRFDAFRMNCGGWEIQVQNIARHVGAAK